MATYHIVIHRERDAILWLDCDTDAAALQAAGEALAAGETGLVMEGVRRVALIEAPAVQAAPAPRGWADQWRARLCALVTRFSRPLAARLCANRRQRHPKHP
jgi:hypothetical protein